MFELSICASYHDSVLLQGELGVGHYKAAKPQVLSRMSKRRQFGRLKPNHTTCCICQEQPVPHGKAPQIVCL